MGCASALNLPGLDRLATIDGVGTPDEVFERIVAAVERNRR